MRSMLSALLSLLAITAMAAEPAGLETRDGYVRGLPPSVRNTAAYLVLHNHAEEPLVLIGGRSPVAGETSLHETVSEGGQMLMRHRGEALIEPGGELVLEPGGLHLMLMDLHAPLAVDSEVELTLLFEGGLEKTLRLPVRDVRGETGGHAH